MSTVDTQPPDSVPRRAPAVGDPLAPYLFDPNYYKLGHQLVAEDANRAARAMLRAGRNPRGKGAAPQRTDTHALSVEGLQEAAVLIQEVDAVRAELARRSRLRRRIIDPLTNKELRLYRFLAGTVDPCIRLVAAGLDALLPDGDPLQRFPKARDDLSVTAVGWRLVTTYEIRVPWSPRAFYNLACFLSLWMRDMSPDDRVSQMRALAQREYVPLPASEPRRHPAVWALQEALTRSHGRDRKRMLNQISDDPTLAPLLRSRDTRPVVDALLLRYTLPDPERKEPPDPQRPSGHAKSAMPISASELATFWQAVEADGWPPSFARRVLNAARDPDARSAYVLESMAGWRALAQTIEAHGS